MQKDQERELGGEDRSFRMWPIENTNCRICEVLCGDRYVFRMLAQKRRICANKVFDNH